MKFVPLFWNWFWSRKFNRFLNEIVRFGSLRIRVKAAHSNPLSFQNYIQKWHISYLASLATGSPIPKVVSNNFPSIKEFVAKPPTSWFSLKAIIIGRSKTFSFVPLGFSHVKSSSFSSETRLDARTCCSDVPRLGLDFSERPEGSLNVTWGQHTKYKKKTIVTSVSYVKRLSLEYYRFWRYIN